MMYHRILIKTYYYNGHYSTFVILWVYFCIKPRSSNESLIFDYFLHGAGTSWVGGSGCVECGLGRARRRLDALERCITC